MKELKDVGNWYSLGFYLGVKPKNLEYLKHSHYDPDQCLIQVINKWLLNDTEASWQTVVNALVNIEHSVLAKNIASKFGK